MRVAALALTITLLAGCSLPITEIPRPEGGFRQMRAVEPLTLRVWTGRPTYYAAGTVFTQSHTRNADGRALWCTGAGDAFECLAFEPGRALLHAQAPQIGGLAWAPLPDGALEEVRR